MDSIYRKEEIIEILSNYNLGNFKSFGSIKKNDTVSFGQVIVTTKSKIFMKVLRKFNSSIKQSIKLCFVLKEKGFPTYNTYLTNDNNLYLEYKNQKIVFYEYIPNIKNEWKNLSEKEIYSFAKTLAKFHILKPIA